jgi:hypothetical protein
VEQGQRIATELTAIRSMLTGPGSSDMKQNEATSSKHFAANPISVVKKITKLTMVALICIIIFKGHLFHQVE